MLTYLNALLALTRLLGPELEELLGLCFSLMEKVQAALEARGVPADPAPRALVSLTEEEEVVARELHVLCRRPSSTFNAAEYAARWQLLKDRPLAAALFKATLNMIAVKYPAAAPVIQALLDSLD